MSDPPDRPIAPRDSIWLAMDRPDNRMVVIGVMLLGEVPDWQLVSQLLQDRIIDTYPVFRQRPRRSLIPGRRLRWVTDPDFDLERHVHRATLPAPRDDSALQRYIEQHVPKAFDPDHPLWEVHFIEVYGSGAAIVTRTHHAMADGLALGQVMLSLTDDRASGRTEAQSTVPPPAADRDPFALGLDLARGALDRTLQFWTPHGIRQTAKLTVGTTKVLGKLLSAKNPETPLSGAPAPSKRIIWSEPIPLAGAKQAGRLAGATVNDVLLTAMSGALRIYQESRDADPVDLLTMVPVNLRPLEVPPPRELGNDFTLVYFSYPSATVAPLARLSETKTRMDRIKHSPEAIITTTFMDVIGRVGYGADRLAIDFFADKAIGVTTNVMGPRTRRWLAGVPLDGVLGWVPGSGTHTIGLCLFSYAGAVRIGMLTDATLIPDPERLIAAFEDEFNQLVRIGSRE